MMKASCGGLLQKFFLPNHFVSCTTRPGNDPHRWITQKRVSRTCPLAIVHVADRVRIDNAKETPKLAHVSMQR